MVLCGETENNVGRLYEDKTKKAVWSHIVKVFVKQSHQRIFMWEDDKPQKLSNVLVKKMADPAKIQFKYHSHAVYYCR